MHPAGERAARSAFDSALSRTTQSVMKRQATRRRVEGNLEELDQIIDHGTRAALSESDGQKIKAALHAMADRLIPKRSTEKTSAGPAAHPEGCCANRG